MHKLHWVSILLLSLLISPLHAITLRLDREIWYCYAQDAADQTYIAISGNEWTSLRNAMKICKTQSKNSKTCIVSREDCDALMNGVSVRPLWQCKALDALGHSWSSGIYRVADNAIQGARTRCYSHSAAPTTCYVHSFTCRNLNPS